MGRNIDSMVKSFFSESGEGRLPVGDRVFSDPDRPGVRVYSFLEAVVLAEWNPAEDCLRILPKFPDGLEIQRLIEAQEVPAYWAVGRFPASVKATVGPLVNEQLRSMLSRRLFGVIRAYYQDFHPEMYAGSDERAARRSRFVYLADSAGNRAVDVWARPPYSYWPTGRQSSEGGLMFSVFARPFDAARFFDFSWLYVIVPFPAVLRAGRVEADWGSVVRNSHRGMLGLAREVRVFYDFVSLFGGNIDESEFLTILFDRM